MQSETSWKEEDDEEAGLSRDALVEDDVDVGRSDEDGEDTDLDVDDYAELDIDSLGYHASEDDDD